MKRFFKEMRRELRAYRNGNSYIAGGICWRVASRDKDFYKILIAVMKTL